MRATLRALEYVVAAAEAGSVSQAAARLNVSQPSVSGAISQLEAELNLALFVRHHARGISLTPTGQRIIAEARALLNHAADFARSAKSFGSTTQGEITVGCFTTLATRYMPPLLARFAVEHPGIKINLREGDQSEILEDLQSGRTEFALSYGYALTADITGEPLARLSPYAMIGADHRLVGRASLSLREIVHEPYILLDLPHSRDYFMAIFASCGLSPAISFRSRSYELIRGLVGHGQGYTILNVMPRTSMAYDGSRVAILRIEEPVLPVELMGLRLRRLPPRPVLQTFAAMLRTAFHPGGFLDPALPAPNGRREEPAEAS